MATALRFVRRQHKAENATTFYFEPETPLAYQAGQYLNYTPPHPNPDNRGVTRSFTLSSFPEEPLLSLTTRLSTPRSTALAGLEPDAVLEANGPFGSFVCRQTDLPLAFIAGGIGVTPFRSILGNLAARRTRASVHGYLAYLDLAAPVRWLLVSSHRLLQRGVGPYSMVTLQAMAEKDLSEACTEELLTFLARNEHRLLNLTFQTLAARAKTADPL